MKIKLIVAALLICTTTATFAVGPKNSAPEKSKTISVNADFKKVIVGDNVKIVFTEDAVEGVTVSGNSKFVDNIQIVNKNGKLSIISLKGQNDGTIYISVKNLKEIEMGTNAKVFSNGFLRSSDLTVYIGEGSHAEIKNVGNMNIKPSADTELNFERYQSIKE